MNYEDQQKTGSLLDEACIPLRHNCEPTDLLLRQAGPWLDAFNAAKLKMETAKGATLALVGWRGNGKTQMAVELIKLRCQHLKSARFVTAVEFFMHVKRSYKPDWEESEIDVLAQFRKYSLLVIDEIGKCGETEWQNTLLFELLNRRYNSMKDTILICNRTKEEFEAMIGPSLASRMNEGGGILVCDWPSFRE